MFLVNEIVGYVHEVEEGAAMVCVLCVLVVVEVVAPPHRFPSPSQALSPNLAGMAIVVVAVAVAVAVAVGLVAAVLLPVPLLKDQLLLMS
jgi:hypothetical protein